MASIGQALVATTQKLRQYYKIVSGDDRTEVAIPTMININSLIKHLEVKNWPNVADQYKNDYELARLANAIVNRKMTWEGTEEALWSIYEDVLDSNNTEVNENIVNDWRRAVDDLEHSILTTPNELEYCNTFVSNDPSWEKIEISERDFDALIRDAEQDVRFAAIAKVIFGGGDTDLLDIKKISFERASLGIDRPWYNESLIESTNWKLRPGGTIDGKNFLSKESGSDAYRGALPGIPEKFVVIRNFEMTYRVPKENEDKVKKAKENGVVFNFGSILLKSSDIKMGRVNVVKGLNTSLLTRAHLNTNLVPVKTVKAESAPFTPISSMKAKPVASPGNMRTTNLMAGLATRRNLTLPITKAPLVRSGLKPKTSFIKHANLSTMKFSFTVPLKGVVKGQNGKGIPIAEIFIKEIEKDGAKESGSLQSVKTDRQGNYSVKLKKGTKYKLTVTKSGFGAKEVTIDTGTKSKLTKNITLGEDAEKPLDAIELVSDIQLLAIVYKKYGDLPKPNTDANFI